MQHNTSDKGQAELMLLCPDAAADGRQPSLRRRRAHGKGTLGLDVCTIVHDPPGCTSVHGVGLPAVAMAGGAAVATDTARCVGQLGELRPVSGV